MMEVSSMLYLFAVVALVIGVVLMLVIVVQNSCEVDTDENKHNTTRATLFLLLAFTLALFVLVQQRLELKSLVSDALSL